MWKILPAAATAIALLGMPALADMATLDTNADGQIDQSEFQAGAGESFGALDADQDGSLNEEEFTAGSTGEASFGDLDADADGMVSQEEYSQSVFAKHDADGDDMWNESEYGAYEAEQAQ